MKGDLRMKIVRYKLGNNIDYGKLEDNVIKKIGGNIFDDYYLTEKTIPRTEVEILPPVSPPNIIAIGLNYEQHAREGGHELPERPVIFIKATTSLIGPEEDIVLPKIAPDKVDYEAELAVIIGKKAKNVEKDDIDDYILGYTCANDVSARDCQLELDEQWARGKSFDTFCPLGPWIETSINPNNCNITSRLNDEVMQNSNTSDMIFDVRELVSYCSKNMTLLPGTVIITGTPEGVGVAREPQVFLEAGDIIEIEIEGIGVLKNHVIESDSEQKKKGSKIAKVWSKYFGTVQLTPHLFDKFKTYIDDGIQEEVIIEVMKITSQKNKGNPSSYMVSILNNFIEQGIYTMKDLKEKGEGTGEQIRKNHSTKKKETKREELEELYRQGYR